MVLHIPRYNVNRLSVYTCKKLQVFMCAKQKNMKWVFNILLGSWAEYQRKQFACRELWLQVVCLDLTSQLIFFRCTSVIRSLWLQKRLLMCPLFKNIQPKKSVLWKDSLLFSTTNHTTARTGSLCLHAMFQPVKNKKEFADWLFSKFVYGADENDI